MTSERTPETGTPEHGLAIAADSLLSELERTNAWLGELEEEIRTGLARRARLMNAADDLILALEPTQQPGFRRRFIAETMKVKPRPRRRNATLNEVLVFLAAHGAATVEPEDIRQHLASIGKAHGRGYAVNTLLKLEKTGAVVRAGYGRYRVNRQHPEVLGAEMTQLIAGGTGPDRARSPMPECAGL
ncbi:MAG: hypothetical protein AAFN27_00115 [Pseudomonadota bacterium]